MKTHIHNAILLTPHKRIKDAVLTISGSVIESIKSKSDFFPKTGRVIDAHGGFVTPGFIDLHFHGAMGAETMDGTSDALLVMSEHCARHGVTTFYPTTWSAAPSAVMAAIECVRLNAGCVTGARIAGIHLEGPYINPHYSGAQLEGNIRIAEINEYRRWFDSGVVRIVTCAPEVKGVDEFINEALRYGVRVAIGHSNASYEQVKTVAAMGVTQATHLFNGMGGLHHREPGTAGGVLDDDCLLAQVICDGVHLHPAVLRLILKAKSYTRIALITDSIRGTGMADGLYSHDGQEIIVKDGIARDENGRLSGSTLTMDKALCNMITYTGCSLQHALAMVTTVPAEEMGLGESRGQLEPGFDADLVLLGKNLEVKATMVAGNFVFSADSLPTG